MLIVAYEVLHEPAARVTRVVSLSVSGGDLGGPVCRTSRICVHGIHHGRFPPATWRSVSLRAVIIPPVVNRPYAWLARLLKYLAWRGFEILFVASLVFAFGV